MTQSLSCRISSRISALRNSPFPDAVDRGVDSVDLAAERLERAPVHERGAAVQVQAWRRRAARRACASWTAASVGSRSTRMFHGTSARSYCPAETSAQPARSSAWFENGPSRRTRSSDCSRALEVGRFEQHRAEHQVRLVADRVGSARRRRELPGPVELLDRLLRPAVLQQRDAEVVGGETRSGSRRAAGRCEHLDGVARAGPSAM